MFESRNRGYVVLIVALALALVAPGVGAALDEAAPDGAEAVLTEVDAIKVCMVNDELFAKDQIPVEVYGKTYYGCCEMCKTRLAKDEAIRYSVDPLTGEKVDKATAVKAASADGSIFYFENREHLEAYIEQLAEESSGE